MRRFQRNLAAAAAISDDLVWIYGEQGAIVEWDEKCRNVASLKTWESVLPGFAQVLRTAGGDLDSYRKLADRGLMKRLRIDSSGPFCLTNAAVHKVSCQDRVCAGDVLYLRMKKSGPFPSVCVNWLKDGRSAKVDESGLVIPGKDKASMSPECVLDERFVIPEGANGLELVLGAPWAKRSGVCYRDLELYVFEQKDAFGRDKETGNKGK